MTIAIVAGAGLLIAMYPGLITARIGNSGYLFLILVSGIGLAYVARPRSGGRGT